MVWWRDVVAWCGGVVWWHGGVAWCGGVAWFSVVAWCGVVMVLVKRGGSGCVV